MSFYRPNYRDPYDYPPPPPSPGPMQQPYSLGPPPSYDQYRSVDSYRPPQADFSFRNNDTPRFLDAPRYPQEHRQENGHARPRNPCDDNRNLNRPRRGQIHKPRGTYRSAPADRPLLRHQDENGSNEQMLGMTTGQKFMATEDISDSEEAEMDESDSDAGQDDSNNVIPVAMPTTDGDSQAPEESLEPPSKRRAIASTSLTSREAVSEPKWSNPDPYTVLPPVDEQRKRKDVVKLIRKSRKEAEGGVAELNQVAANDDFISFGMDDDKGPAPRSPGGDGLDSQEASAPGPLSAPRSFSHLQNLHGQQTLEKSELPVSVRREWQPPGPAPTPVEFTEEVVLDILNTPQNAGSLYDEYARDSNEAFGNRKRTHDDKIKNNKNNGSHINGSILREWLPLPSTNTTPWLRRSETMTASAGFRLHKEICDFYNFVKPQPFEQVVRQDLLSRLQRIVTDEIPHADVVCFGSFAAGMYLPNADMDVVVISSSFRTSGKAVTCQTTNHLRRFSDFVRKSGLGTDVEMIAKAKVPLIKFIDRLTGIRVDVSFENNTGILANHTFTDWKSQYPAMPVLVTIIKQFLMMRGMNEVVHGGLGGFSVTCLVTSLLQNMPRVQSGEMVPEEHFGELLIEFLDLYGNRFDTTRTGISMRPPGYFEKHNKFRPNQVDRGIYSANKSERLAIMDPNSEFNDISGGSRLVLLIFERFSCAHKEILKAMKSPNRASLLDWSLGGKYDSFTTQRKRLRDLYEEGHGVLEGTEDRGYHIPEMTISGGDRLPDQSPAIIAEQQDLEAVLHEVGSGVLKAKKRKTPAEKKATLIERRQRKAVALKTAYPDMRNIPNQITNGQRQQLIAKYVAAGGQPLPEKSKKNSTPAQKNRQRAQYLKIEFPNMINIPDTLTKKQRQKLVTEYSSQPRSQTGQQPAKQEATKPRKPRMKRSEVAKSASRPATVQQPQIDNTTNQHSNVSDSTGYSVSKKMAPLSEARLAEVALNFQGTSNNDPINLD